MVRDRSGSSPPLELKAIRQEFIDKDLFRIEIDERVRRIVRMSRQGIAEELVPTTVHPEIYAERDLEAPVGGWRSWDDARHAACAGVPARTATIPFPRVLLRQHRPLSDDIGMQMAVAAILPA